MGQLTIRPMNRTSTAFAFVLIFLILCHAHRAFSQPSSASRNQQAGDSAQSPPEEAIKHLLMVQVEAWNKGDLEGFMDGYWHSPDLTFFSGGNVAKGWQAALERYQHNYQGTGKEMGRLEFEELNIDLLGERAAVVRGKWRLTMSDGKTPHGLFTLIVKRLPNGWHIVHDHTSAAEQK